MERILEVNNLEKTYTSVANLFKLYRQSQTKAVDKVSFHINKGESFGLVGESGSGKSTVANIIAGLVKADAGQVIFKGQDVLQMTTAQRRATYKYMQMVFQDPYSTLNPKKTVGWSISEALFNQNELSKKEIKDRAIQALEDVNMDASYYDRYPHNLSGGQRQRISIASAIISKPDMIIIDEGVSSLDVSIQASILNLLNDLKAKYGLTYLFISHDLNVIEYFCDRIAVMYQGRLVEVFNAETFDMDEHDAYTKSLFDAIPEIYLEGNDE